MPEAVSFEAQNDVDRRAFIHAMRWQGSWDPRQLLSRIRVVERHVWQDHCRATRTRAASQFPGVSAVAFRWVDPKIFVSAGGSADQPLLPTTQLTLNRNLLHFSTQMRLSVSPL